MHTSIPKKSEDYLWQRLIDKWQKENMQFHVWKSLKNNRRKIQGLSTFVNFRNFKIEFSSK